MNGLIKNKSYFEGLLLYTNFTLKAYVDIILDFFLFSMVTNCSFALTLRFKRK